jgi:hypothetical protein
MALFSTHKGIGSKYVLLAGSKNLKSDIGIKTKLAIELGKLIASEKGWVLINGGALNDNNTDKPEAIDYFGALGANDEALKLNLNPADKILTIKPQTQTQHSFHNFGKIETVKKNTTALRRFEMVARADAIITIEGGEGITNILELGISLNKAVLPIAASGGTSGKIWNDYEMEILEKFFIKKNSPEYRMLTEKIENIELAAKTYIDVIKKALLPECFIIMPFNKGLDFVYNDCIKSAVTDAGLKPVRADEIASTSFIYSDMYHSIAAAKIVIADITPINMLNNPNVFYEIGMAHAMKKEVILINQQTAKGTFLQEPPIDIQSMRIFGYKPENLKGLYDILLNNLLSLKEYI